ncbi:MAG: transglutaminase domain-containing protein [Erysipelotrichaceae bacterium]|nr:transglutaminase domain-containing protein [Erysipelotrichaceae bacterium]
MKRIRRLIRQAVMMVIICTAALFAVFALSPQTGKVIIELAGLLSKRPESTAVSETAEEQIQAEQPSEPVQVYEFDELYYPYYRMLSDNQKYVYQQVYREVLSMNAETVPEVNISEEDASEAAMALLYDHPELFWLDTAFSYQYTEDHVCTKLIMQFNDTADHIEETKKLFEENADAIINEALKCSGDYEKEKYVHDALLDMAGYDTEAAMNQSAFSALVSRTTVCAGYARAFQYLMTRLGIPCYYVTGYAEGEHAWNTVKLDGEFYNVDLTWDKGSLTGYDYFNVPDSRFQETHQRTGRSLKLPACNGTAYASLKAGITSLELPDIFRNHDHPEDGFRPGGH